MNERELADLVLAMLKKNLIPWHYSQNQFPPFDQLFGNFSTGVPLKPADADYSPIQSLIAATHAEIWHHPRIRTPRYERPPKDRIMLPPRSRFPNEASYWATTIHELIHWLEWRIGWNGSLAEGELIAEIGTAKIESYFCLPHDLDRTNCEKWLPEWTVGIQADPTFLFDCNAQADKAVNRLLEMCGEALRKETEVTPHFCTALRLPPTLLQN